MHTTRSMSSMSTDRIDSRARRGRGRRLASVGGIGARRGCDDRRREVNQRQQATVLHPCPGPAPRTAGPHHRGLEMDSHRRCRIGVIDGKHVVPSPRDPAARPHPLKLRSARWTDADDGWTVTGALTADGEAGSMPYECRLQRGADPRPNCRHSRWADRTAYRSARCSRPWARRGR